MAISKYKGHKLSIKALGSITSIEKKENKEDPLAALSHASWWVHAPYTLSETIQHSFMTLAKAPDIRGKPIATGEDFRLLLPKNWLLQPAQSLSSGFLPPLSPT